MEDKATFTGHDYIEDVFAVVNGDKIVIKSNGELRVFLSEEDALDSIPDDEGGRDYEVRRCAVVVSKRHSEYQIN